MMMMTMRTTTMMMTISLEINVLRKFMIEDLVGNLIEVHWIYIQIYFVVMYMICEN